METNTFTSFHTDKVYTIKQELTCTTEGVIYLLHDKMCQRSYVGSTITDMRTRAANYRSHIQTQHKGCEIATHFAEYKDNHPLPKKGETTTTKSEYLGLYNNHLSNHIEFVLIDRVIFPANASSTEKRSLMEKSEGYWQTQLRTMKKYGGLNIKDERKIRNTKNAKNKGPQNSLTTTSTKLVTPPPNNKPPTNKDTSLKPQPAPDCNQGSPQKPTRTKLSTPAQNTKFPKPKKHNLNPQPKAEDPEAPPLRRSSRIKKQKQGCHICD